MRRRNTYRRRFKRRPRYVKRRSFRRFTRRVQVASTVLAEKKFQEIGISQDVGVAPTPTIFRVPMVSQGTGGDSRVAINTPSTLRVGNKVGITKIKYHFFASVDNEQYTENPNNYDPLILRFVLGRTMDNYSDFVSNELASAGDPLKFFFLTTKPLNPNRGKVRIIKDKTIMLNPATTNNVTLQAEIPVVGSRKQIKGTIKFKKPKTVQYQGALGDTDSWGQMFCMMATEVESRIFVEGWMRVYFTDM